MKQLLLTLVLLLGAYTVAVAGDFEDGMAMYERKDYAAAFAKYTKAAEAGVALAQYNLAWMYENGQGVTPDDGQAMRWYTKAAEAGVALAQYNLALRYHNGKGVPQDYAQAAGWYTKAAEAGVAMAQYNLALMYENGQGVAQDDAQAEKWYSIAATTLTDNVEKDKAINGRNRLEVKLRARRTAEAIKLADAQRTAEAQRLAKEQAERAARPSVAPAPSQPIPDTPAAPPNAAPAASPVVVGPGSIAGVVLVFVGGLWITVKAFREKLLWGLVCFFIPGVFLVYGLMRWDEAKIPFIISLIGIALYFVGGGRSMAIF